MDSSANDGGNDTWRDYVLCEFLRKQGGECVISSSDPLSRLLSLLLDDYVYAGRILDLLHRSPEPSGGVFG